MKRYAGLFALLAGWQALAQTGWEAGVAKAVITPREPVWMAGFGSRNRPSEGVRQDIYARALALKDTSGKTSVILTLDLVAVDRRMADEVAARCLARFGVPWDRLLLNVSHTHSGPVAGLDQRREAMGWLALRNLLWAPWEAGEACGMAVRILVPPSWRPGATWPAA